MSDLQGKVSYLPDLKRLLPQSLEAERALLGSILLLPKEVMELCQQRGVKPQSFHHPSHRMIYEMLLDFWNENEPITLEFVTQAFADAGTLDAIGGAVIIAELYTTGSPHFASNYIDTLHEKLVLRTINAKCTELASRTYDEQDNVKGLLADTEEALICIVKTAEGQKTHARDMKELVHRAMDRLQTVMEGDGKIDMPTGLIDLDRECMGFVAPMVTVISGKSSDGKTSLAMNIAEHLAINCGKRVGIISLEMSDDQLVDRLLASMAWTNIRAIKRDRSMTEREGEKIAEAAKKLAEAKIFIRDDGQLSISEISATFSAWKSKHGLDFGIIDHAQLARGDGKTSGRTEEVEQISRALKPMAKRLEIPLLVLSQVTDNAGILSTKNSKALSEDADNLFTISHKYDDGKLESSAIHISKQRDGERNISVPVVFIPSLMRFTNKARQEQPELAPKNNRKNS